MRKTIGALAGIVTVLSSCGGESSSSRTSVTPPTAAPPPPTSTAGCSLTERQNWAASQINSNYLFPETLPANPSPSGYASVQDYIDFLTSRARAQQKDRFFTYITSIEEENAYYNSGANAGLGVRLSLTSNNELFVNEAFENAPGLAAGLDRGTEIIGIGTNQSNIRTVADILASSGSQGLSDALGPSTAGVTRVYRIRNAGGEKTVSITKAAFELTPVSTRYGAKIIEDDGEKIGYLNLRQFIGPAEAPLRNAFTNFRNQGVRKVIVDFRYNGGGLVSIAETLGNLLGGGRSSSDIFSYTTFRQSLASNNETTRFAPAGNAVAPLKLAFIGTGGTASASELVMNSFIPYLSSDNALIGTNTYGKPVGQIAVDRPQCDDRLRVVAFRTENANRQGDYYSGLASFMKTTCVAADDIRYQLGDPQEASTRQALDFLKGRGTCTPIASSSASEGIRAQGNTQLVPTEKLELLTPQDATTPQRETPGLF